MNTDTITTLCIATIFIFPLLFGVIEYVTTPARVKKKLEQILDQRKRINNDLNTLKELSGLDEFNNDYNYASKIIVNLPISNWLEISRNINNHTQYSFSEYGEFDKKLRQDIIPKLNDAESTIQRIWEIIDQWVTEIKGRRKELEEIALLANDAIMLDCDKVLKVYDMGGPFTSAWVSDIKDSTQTLQGTINLLKDKVDKTRQVINDLPLSEVQTKAAEWVCLHVEQKEINQACYGAALKLFGIKKSSTVFDFDEKISSALSKRKKAENFYSNLCGKYQILQELVERINKEEDNLCRILPFEEGDALSENIKNNLESNKKNYEYDNVYNNLNQQIRDLQKILYARLGQREIIMKKTDIRVREAGIIATDTNFQGNPTLVGTQHDSNFKQNNFITNNLYDLKGLAKELYELSIELQQRATKPEHHMIIGNIEYATQEAKKGDRSKVMKYLSQTGKWAFDVAKELGKSIAVSFLKEAIGIK